MKYHCSERQASCISSTIGSGLAGNSEGNDSNSILVQLTRTMERQTEEAKTANKLKRVDIRLKKNNKDTRKDHFR